MDSPVTELKIRTTKKIAEFFSEHNFSILISSHENGQVISLGSLDHQFTYRAYTCAKPMGMSATSDRLAIVADDSIKLFNLKKYSNSQDQKNGQYQESASSFVSSHSRYLGKIDCHEIAFLDESIVFANTKLNCLCEVGELNQNHFVPIWKPAFIDRIVYEDRCHLNGLACDPGREDDFVVSCHGHQNFKKSWSNDQQPDQGCLIHSRHGTLLSDGLVMPHSPRFWNNQIVFCNSGYGTLDLFDIESGKHETIFQLPGFTRGLSIFKQYAIVGFSKARERSFFKNLPILDGIKKDNDLRCGLAIIDLVERRMIHGIEFLGLVNEVFTVQILNDMQIPELIGLSHASTSLEFDWMNVLEFPVDLH